MPSLHRDPVLSQLRALWFIIDWTGFPTSALAAQGEVIYSVWGGKLHLGECATKPQITGCQEAIAAAERQKTRQTLVCDVGLPWFVCELSVGKVRKRRQWESDAVGVFMYQGLTLGVDGKSIYHSALWVCLQFLLIRVGVFVHFCASNSY